MKAHKFLAFLLIVLFFSCNSDDGSTPSTLNFHGTGYTLHDGKAIDISGWLFDNGSHYVMVMTDGQISVSEDVNNVLDVDVENATIDIRAYLICEGEALQNGTYEWRPEATPQMGLSIDDVMVVVEEGGGLLGDNTDDMQYYAVGGTITVSGSGINRTMDFNMELYDGSMLDFTYHSGFDYVDHRND